MKGKLVGLNVSPWLGGVVVVAISALVGSWQAKLQSSPESSRYADIVLVDHETDHIEQVEQALAQTGCPGGMVLASEGPSALGPEVIPPEIRTISASVPRVKYPEPLRVASRVSTRTPSATAVTTPDSANDPDDLLDGTADLLWKNDAAQEAVPSAPVPVVEEPAESVPTVERERGREQLNEAESHALPVPLPPATEEIAPPQRASCIIGIRKALRRLACEGRRSGASPPVQSRAGQPQKLLWGEPESKIGGDLFAGAERSAC